MRNVHFAVLLAFALLPAFARAEDAPDRRFPLFAYLTGSPSPTMVTYTPSELDPRQEVNQRRLKTSSIRADLEALRPHFDGLVLYGYHEACTPRILAVARDLKFRAVLLGIWDPKSAAGKKWIEGYRKMEEGELLESVRMRRTLLALLLPELSLGKAVTLDERHLKVKGKLGTYRIHLGTIKTTRENGVV